MLASRLKHMRRMGNNNLEIRIAGCSVKVLLLSKTQQENNANT